MPDKLKRIPVLQKKIALNDASRVVSHQNKRMSILVRQSQRDYLMERLNRHPLGAVFRHTNTRILFSNLLIFKFTDFQTVPPCAGY